MDDAASGAGAVIDRLIYRLVVFCAAMAVASSAGLPWLGVTLWAFFLLGSAVPLAWIRP